MSGGSQPNHEVSMEIPEVQDAQQLKSMPSEYQEILVHQLLAHTSGELSGGDTYIRVAPFAPNAYELKILYQFAAEEINHYMIGAELLSDIGVDTEYMLKQQLSERDHYASDFVHEYANWYERGLTSLLAEWAALEHIYEMQKSSYLPLARSCASVARDEMGHVAHGFRVTKSQCETDEGRAAVQAILDRKWGQVLDLFGASNSRRSVLFLKWGLRQYSNEEARQRWATQARAKLEKIGLTPPPDHVNRKFL
jgi:ring-1,2-phenylacetyl-CoA epoxidase subunit PaaA